MARALIPFLAGLVAGVVGALVAGSFSGKGITVEEHDKRISHLVAEKKELLGRLEDSEQRYREVATQRDLLEAEAEELKTRFVITETTLAELRAEVAAAAEPEVVAPTGAVTEEEMRAAISEFGSSLQAVIVGNGADAVAKLRAVLDRAGPEGIRKLIDFLENDADLGGKIVLAHALAQSGDPEALKALTNLATDSEQSMILRRFIAHGLAFADEESLQPVLWEIARNDADIGARANAAFGIARTGNDDGVKLYAEITDEAFEKKDPTALQYLSGFLLMGKKGLPYVRERLESYKESQARLFLMEVVKQEKDKESIPVLRRIIANPATDKTVRGRAETILAEIEAE